MERNMEHTPLTLLNLCTPLQYVKTERQTASILKNEEMLLCYEVNSVQGGSIEPDRERFLGRLLFTGEKPPETPSVSAEKTEEFVSLPQGDYLFMQCRSGAVLTSDEWLDLAIEQQKDALWERNKPLNLLYVRFLFEDGAFVTQVFRAV
jgi:hypothetical protein